jgi:transposase-like protein
MTMYTDEERKKHVDEYLKEKAEGTIHTMRDYCAHFGLNETTFGGWVNHGFGMHPKYPKAKREACVSAYLKEKEENGTTIRAYCEKAGLNPKTFSAWMAEDAPSQGMSGSQFVRVKAGTAGTTVRIEYYGAVITVGEGALPMVLSVIRDA